MIFSITGFAFLLLFLGIGGFASASFRLWKELEARQRKESEIGKWLLYSLSTLSLSCLEVAVIGLLFNQNPMMLKVAVIIATFFLALSAGGAMYLVFFLVPFKASPWYGFWGALIFGLLVGLFTSFSSFTPYVERNGVINWGLYYPPLNILQFLLYLIALVPIGLVFLRQFYLSRNKDVKIKALVMAFAFFFGLIIAYTEFVLEPLFQLPALTSDIVMIISSIFLIICWVLPFVSTEQRSNNRDSS